MVRSGKQGSSKCSLRGSGTPHSTYDRVNGVYRYKHGGSMFEALKKSLANVGAKVIKAAKPLGKKMVKKGMKIVTNPKNQKKI